MRARTARWWCCWSLAVVAGAVCATTARGEGAPRRPKLVEWNASQAAQACCFTILGAIAEPGVYESATGSITLQRLVQQAGGLSPHAAQAMRVIRQGRAGTTLFYSPSASNALAPGDIVVVDASQQFGADRRQAAAEGVTVCFVGLTDKPVVVTLERQNAVLPTVMKMLNQTAELANTVQVIASPGTLPSQRSASGSFILPNAAVLVFPPNLIVASNLPEFPEPFTITDAEPVQSPLAVSAPESDIAPPPPERELDGTALPIAGSGNITAVPVPFTRDTEETVARSASVPAPRSRLQPQPSLPRSQPKPTNQAPLSAIPGDDSSEIVAGVTTSEGSAELEFPEEIGTANETFSLWQMFGVGGAVASLIGLSLLTRNYLDRPNFTDRTQSRRSEHSSRLPETSIPEPIRARMQSQLTMPTESSSSWAAIARTSTPASKESIAPPLPKSAVREAHDLAELLLDRQPIVTEALTFPPRIKSLEEQIPERLLRIDPAEELAAPHVTMPTAPLEFNLDAPVAAIPRPHFSAPVAAKPLVVDESKHLISGSPLERALSRLQGAST